MVLTVNEQFNLILLDNMIHFSSSMKFAIEKKALYISIKNPVYGLKTVVYCSV